MLSYLLRKGDRVRMNMHPSSRVGRVYPENGVLGTVLGRVTAQPLVVARYPAHSSRAPGLYSIEGDPIVEWDEYPDGIDLNDPRNHIVSSTSLEPADSFRHEWLRRLKEEWPVRLADGTPNPDFDPSIQADRLSNLRLIGPLPKTKFWELDRVDHNGVRHRVTGVHYLGQNNTGEPFYDLEPIDENGEYTRMGTCMAPENELTLYLRGNVWREYNNEPHIWRDIHEESHFAINMGRAKEVRNPKDLLYRWASIAEIKDAIEKGLGDGFTGSEPNSYIVRRYDDRDLGERMRSYTLRTLNAMEKHFFAQS